MTSKETILIYGKPMITISGNWVFTNQFTGCGDFRAQVRESLSKMKESCSSAGMDPAGYVKCTVMIADVSLFDEFVGIYKEVVAEKLPALTITPERHVIGDGEFGIEMIGIRRGIPEPQRWVSDEARDIPEVVMADSYVFTSAHYPSAMGSFDEEARSALNQLVQSLEKAGIPLNKLVKNLVQLTDCGEFDAFNVIYGDFFKKDKQPPARTLHGVSSLPGNAQLSVETIGYLGETEAVTLSNSTTIDLPFCLATKAGNLMFISGQIGLDSKTGILAPDFETQEKQMLNNVFGIAKAGGSSIAGLLKCNVFICDILMADKFYDIFTEVAGKCDCCLSIYEVNGLAYPPIIVEMDAIALIE